jgi:hypothetical protein
LFPLPLAGEGQGGGSRRDGSDYCFKDAGTIGHHVVIAKAKNHEALGFNHGRARGVGLFCLIRKMLAAVQLDHQLGGVAHEVGNKVLDGDLAPKAGAVQSVIA